VKQNSTVPVKAFALIQEVEGAEDIHPQSNLSTAWNGDRVLVKLTKEGSRLQPRRRSGADFRTLNQSLLARVKQMNIGFRAVPRRPTTIEIDLHPLEPGRGKQSPCPCGNSPLPAGQSGQVVQILGSDAETASDVDLVCCKHDLPRTFSASVIEAAAGLPSQLSKTDLKQRLDLRSRLTLTLKLRTRLIIEKCFHARKNQSRTLAAGRSLSM